LTIETSQALLLIRSLSLTELQMLRGMVAGESLSAIAFRLALDGPEAQKHRDSMMQKLGATSTADAVRIGIYAALDL
jgi:FixJ family two-component response regulator